MWVNVFVFLSVQLFFPVAALAYLDPGTGSMILQMIIGGIAAALYTLKLYWHKVMKFFGKGGGIEENNEQLSSNVQNKSEE